MTDLKKWAGKHRRYVKMVEGKALYCQLIKYEEFVDKENEDREKIRYFLNVDGDEKLLESQSVGLAENMAKIKPTDWIKLTRTGKGRSTRWEVEKVDPPGDK